MPLISYIRTAKRPSRGAAIALGVGLVGLWCGLRLTAFSGELMPFTYVLPLLVCIWTRSRIMLWLMAGVFVAVAIFNGMVVLPTANPDDYSHADWPVHLATVLNIVVGATVIHLVISLLGRLEKAVADLSTANGTVTQQNEELLLQGEELAQQNEELSQQSEELANQNEELQSQHEELESQNEELQAQSEEIQALNVELTRREALLQKLLDSALVRRRERRVMYDMCQAALEMLGDPAVAAVVLERENNQLFARAETGLNIDDLAAAALPLAGTITEMVMTEDRTASLEDAALRPDIVLLGLENGDGQFRSVLSSPLRIGGEVVGAVNVYSRKPWAWTEEQFRLVEWLGTHCSTVLEILRLQSDLLEAGEQRRLALDSGDIGTWDFDPQSGRLKTGERFRRLLGLDPDEPVTLESVFAAIHEDDRREVRQAMERAMDPDLRESYSREFRVVRSDSSVLWLLMKGQAYFSMPQCRGRAKAMRFIGTIMDMTQRRMMEDSLRRHRDELEQRVQQRTIELKYRVDQLSRLSLELTTAEQRERRRLAEVLHDHLQQLLVGASMQVDLLREREEDADHAEKLGVIHGILAEAIQSTRSLAQDLSPPVLYRGGLRAALKWLADQMRQKHKLAVAIEDEEIPENLPESLAIMLYTSARELLFNVVKHARTLKALLRVGTSDDGIWLEVVDRGQGFDVEKSLSQHGELFEGFGLLSIRERVELMGGRLHVESRVGHGSRFRIQLPLDNEAQKTAEKISADKLVATPVAVQVPAARAKDRQLRVVLVDDHLVVRQGLASLLNKHSAIDIVGEADNGRKAIAIVEEFRPDLVLMDVSMPGMDGIEATRIIKQKWPQTMVIGLSMFEEDELAGKVRAAGADAYLSKAGPSEQLLETVLSMRSLLLPG